MNRAYFLYCLTIIPNYKRLMMKDLQKWELLQEMPFIDAKDGELIDLANTIWRIALHRPNVFLKLALAVARDGITYKSDIIQFDGEDIAGITRPPVPGDALEAYKRGLDDCDAKARLFVALCLARGFEARLWPLWKDGFLTHVAAEVKYNGQWVHAETILSRARLGEKHVNVPKEKDGKWKLT